MPKKTIIKKNSKPNALPIDKQKFILPEQLLNQLEEFTEGGFILIACPAGGGVPEVYNHFDSVTHMYGLHGFSKDYFNETSKKMQTLAEGFFDDGVIIT